MYTKTIQLWGSAVFMCQMQLPVYVLVLLLQLWVKQSEGNCWS